ncbi:MAG: 2-C-methyl-D-erythritol 4-phosphate cytidylyltransferase [Bacteroidales bacterium]|nr:2-C-methyl-D-erythritol 4-phosphate cytidylyltransferase [Bacteroidales bacterium]
MGRKRYLVVTAAGHGTRMGSALPKQFLEFEGKPVLRRTVERFLSADPEIKIVTVLPSDYLEEWRSLCLRTNFVIPQILVQGGITRFHSVQNALSKIPDGAIVAIHDGVRPLVSEKLILEMFEKMDAGCRALIPVLPMVDTLKAIRKVNVDGEERLETIPGVAVDRSTVFGAQTPQMFYSEEIKAAYRQPYSTSFTDDASVAQQFGIPVDYVIGERTNIKLTTPEDLAIASAFAKL